MWRMFLLATWLKDQSQAEKARIIVCKLTPEYKHKIEGTTQSSTRSIIPLIAYFCWRHVDQTQKTAMRFWGDFLGPVILKWAVPDVVINLIKINSSLLVLKPVELACIITRTCPCSNSNLLSGITGKGEVFYLAEWYYCLCIMCSKLVYASAL